MTRKTTVVTVYETCFLDGKSYGSESYIEIHLLVAFIDHVLAMKPGCHSTSCSETKVSVCLKEIRFGKIVFGENILAGWF